MMEHDNFHLRSSGTCHQRALSIMPRSFTLSPLVLVASTLLLLPPTEATTNTGNTQCPCISPDLSAWQDTTQTSKIRATVGAKTYLYDQTYGKASCSTWDSDKPPACALSDGQALANRPDWCTKQWCYVDNSNCGAAFAPAESSYFKTATGASANLHYSYQTCGQSNSFVTWDQQNSNAGKILVTVENTLKTLKREIEANYVTLTSMTANQTASCQDHLDLNHCNTCANTPVNTGWVGSSSKVEFSTTAAFMSDLTDPLYKCLHDQIRLQFLKVANSEYDMVNKNRIAYLYAGFQEQGNYIQWPAMQWTRNGYDPRYRPWYAMIASGPKNIIIVIDTSGSMQQANRLVLAKEAAIKVLGTLTIWDYFLVISFSSDVKGMYDHVVPATDTNKQAATNWINALATGGTTNFRSTLNIAFNRAKRATIFDGTSDPDRCFSAQCKTTILFLSDGIPDAWDPSSDGQNLRDLNPGTQFKLFTYALGVGADTSVLSQLASDHGGEMRQVSDGGNLANTMADYYKKLGDDRDINAVRWMRYTDIVSQTTLLAGCISIDDLRTTAAAKQMVAVACMDANVIASLNQLETLDGYAQFQQDYETNSRMCANGNNPFQEMTLLGCSVQWESLVVASPGTNSLKDGSEEGTKEDDGEAFILVILAVLAGIALIFLCVCLAKQFCSFGYAGSNSGGARMAPNLMNKNSMMGMQQQPTVMHPNNMTNTTNMYNPTGPSGFAHNTNSVSPRRGSSRSPRPQGTVPMQGQFNPMQYNNAPMQQNAPMHGMSNEPMIVVMQNR
ncbi:unnamed protein product [Amoebophrya sp. A120]|nr:unnamed protein product [Amoebophrya sp. A120]|eukprot:GSA120T00020394001.1